MDPLEDVVRIKLRMKEFYSNDELEEFHRITEESKWDPEHAWRYLDIKTREHYERDHLKPNIWEHITNYERS